MTTLASVIQRGTNAARPAATAVPAGTLYYDTTNSLLSRSDGATWQSVGETTAGSGSITASGYTQSTARLLGRTTAATGAIEEITVGSGLSLAAGSLTATGGGGGTNHAQIYIPARNGTLVGAWTIVTYSDISYATPGYQSSGAANDAVSFDLWMEAGTYAAFCTFRKSTNTGIITVNLGGASQGTVDTYAAAIAYGSGAVTGIVVTAGQRTWQLQMATKNASSSSYYGELFYVTIYRTA